MRKREKEKDRIKETTTQNNTTYTGPMLSVRLSCQTRK